MARSLAHRVSLEETTENWCFVQLFGAVSLHCLSRSERRCLKKRAHFGTRQLKINVIINKLPGTL